LRPFAVGFRRRDKKSSFASQTARLSTFKLIAWRRRIDGSNSVEFYFLTIDLWKTSVRIFVCILLFLVSSGLAEAAPKKNWYLRIDNGAGGEAFVFKSKAACEAEGRRRMKVQEEIDRTPQKYESKYRWSNPRCLNFLPHGYLPPP
jgi:hypothetical protein